MKKEIIRGPIQVWLDSIDNGEVKWFTPEQIHKVIRTYAEESGLDKYYNPRYQELEELIDAHCPISPIFIKDSNSRRRVEIMLSKYRDKAIGYKEKKSEEKEAEESKDAFDKYWKL